MGLRTRSHSLTRAASSPIGLVPPLLLGMSAIKIALICDGHKPSCSMLIKNGTKAESNSSDSHANHFGWKASHPLPVYSLYVPAASRSCSPVIGGNFELAVADVVAGAVAAEAVT